eukprot:g6522.t1
MRAALRSVVVLPALLLPVAVAQDTCSNGLVGIEFKTVCCDLGCGSCGGSGCSLRPGGGTACCKGLIENSEVLCSVSGAAPCILDGDIPAPTPLYVVDGDPTPEPTAEPSPEPTPEPSADPTPEPPSEEVGGPALNLEASPVPMTPSLSPTPVMTIPTSCEEGSPIPKFRYAANSGKVDGGRLYAETEGCFTMTDIYNWRGTVSRGGVLSSKGPIFQLDDEGNVLDQVGAIGEPVTGKWLLTAELYMTNGATLYCKGSSVGGDCDEFRIQSTGPTDWYEVRGHGGSMYFENTIVTSWDTPNKKPQEVYEGGRSFLNCVSEKLTGETCDGRAKNEMGECRMDLINSEIGYLGWFDSESYGITWKVRGFCKDLSNENVFETTNVYGDIIGCDIHHNYYGHYSYGHQGGVWINNKMHDNWQYGFDPHDDSDFLTIAGNQVYNNVNHGIIASKRCNNVKIYNNVVRDGGSFAAGIFLHRSSDGAQVYNNAVHNMQDAGIAMLESKGALIYNNSIDKVKYGIRMSLGSEGNTVYRNTFNDCSSYGLFTYQGSDPPTEGVSDGRPKLNDFDLNLVSNTEGGVKIKFTDDMSITNNVFTGATEIEFFDAQSTTWLGNTLPESGVCLDTVTSDKGNAVRESTFDLYTNLPNESC